MTQKDNINLRHWNYFYKSKKLINKPTNFAIFCQKKLKKYKGVIYDVGCGNGRDVIFFNKKKNYCIGIDKSFQAIVNNKNNFFNYKNNFIKRNFCKFFLEKIKNVRFSVYSRFSLHSINSKGEEKLINSLVKQKNLDFLFIETRTLDDDFYGVGKKIGKHEFISTHYRRFIDPLILKKKLKENFKIIYFKKSRGFAKFGKEDPCVLRIIAKKKLI